MSRVFIESHRKMSYLLHMPTEKPIVNFAMDENLLKRIDDYRFENRINTRSEALRRLIEEGLSEYDRKNKKNRK